jgi:RHH-type proline utilization regulon transcriptional repressor/proline dehydrogenase/delta 1-pyrroline-5-carboxylate dehydrogenase
MDRAMDRLKKWEVLDAQKFTEEGRAIAHLLASKPLDLDARAAIVQQADELVVRARNAPHREGIVESFLKEFSLGTREGLALMCLAEALLRTPDPATRDRLIAEKVAMADWASHLGKSDNLFVNASTWGLMLTGKLIGIDAEIQSDVPRFLKRLAARAGEPVIRRAVVAAMGIMGEQFVVGRSIGEALRRAERDQLICSFDMLGEGARTEADAELHYRNYAEAIEAVGSSGSGAGPELGHGISVKLSALSARYEAVQESRVWEELYPRLKALALAAAKHDLNLTIDAEEADRLTLSLKLVGRLAREPDLGDWSGLGVVVQAYQKRGLAVVEGLARLAAETGRRIMVRLVKGAYWDSEIKAAQVAGMPDYPVFTTKPATDLSYLVCARALIAASPRLYPQFATHNAHTLAAVHHMAAELNLPIEYQRLQGMGDALYAAAAEFYGSLRVRTYAPVGGHDDLLPYLVRRLLENGANSSFVHAQLDVTVPVAEVVADPITKMEAQPERHPRIPVPPKLYGEERPNSQGRDWSQLAVRRHGAAAIAEYLVSSTRAGPIIGGTVIDGPMRATVSPSNVDLMIGEVSLATIGHIDLAAQRANRAQPAWDRAGGTYRAQVLRRMGDALEAAGDRLIALLSLEAGKTLTDAASEMREAADYCRYYAQLAQIQFAAPTELQGPVGETNSLHMSGRGIFACISPWNFPLAIFTGQITAALAAGNAVLAKPAEQTPLIAAETVKLFHSAGLDPDLLALLPGSGNSIGAALVAHPAVAGVAFTGGTETAWAINRSLAQRSGPIIPLIAETGGLNAMFVDTTALHEQVIDDAIVSAFGSAGQRCSALRMLFLPEENADAIITRLVGALATRVVGDASLPETDIGPLIDAEALDLLNAHVVRLEREARIIARHPGCAGTGHYFGPIIAEVVEPEFLKSEVFGPILHVCRYAPERLQEYATRLTARGYGLTLGIHSRLDSFVKHIQALVPAGNVYVNRSIIGAVVGVQPFGGLGLSGTGSKVGGPLSLLRYSTERSVSVNIMAQGGDPALFSI